MRSHTRRSRGRSPRSGLESLGWEAVQAHERELGERFLDGLPAGIRLVAGGHVEPGADYRLSVADLAPAAAAEALAERDIAVWAGNYYALEIMERLGLPDGAVRVGIVHYNTAEEVDRLLDELGRLA